MFRCLMMLCLFAVAAPAMAQQRTDSGIQLTPFAGYTIGGEVDAREDTEQETNNRLRESSSYGFVLNWPSKAPTEWELYYNHQDTELAKGGPGVKLDTLQLGGTYLGQGSKHARPFFVATLGGMRIKPEATDNDYFVSFTLGGGYKFFPTKRIGIRLEARALGTFISSNNSWFCSGGSNGATCAVRTSGNLLIQAQANAGVIIRF